MIANIKNIPCETETDNNGKKLFLHDLTKFENSDKIPKMFSVAILEKGAEVPYHIHDGETERYYIISGTGEYNDNGAVCKVEAGTVTCTTTGMGHGLKNIGDSELEFIALITED